MAGEREYGTVAKWVCTFGFVAPDNGGQDVFVSFHHLEMDGYKTLREGQTVSFARGLDDNGRRCAVAVRVETDDPEVARG